MRSALLCSVLLAGCACAPAKTKRVAEAPEPPAATAPTVAEADAKFDAGDCAGAAAAYEAAAAAGPIGLQPRLRIAICRLEAGDRDGALLWIEKALAGGFPPYVQVLPPRLQPLTDDARLEALMAKHRDACADPDRRGFDFWLGSWDVFDPKGNQLGSNEISAEQGGCVLVERWRGTPGDTGQSINYYDASRRIWHQLWTAGNGTVTRYEGTLVDGVMTFEGTQVLRDGTALPLRMTFTPQADGTVVQRIEQTADGGATWTVSFEGTYRKRAS